MEQFRAFFSKMNLGQLVLLFAAGFVLVFLSFPQKESSKTSTGSQVQSQEEELAYEEKLEQKLEQILSQVEGIGEVDVIINLKASGEIVLNKDRSSSSSAVTESGQSTKNSQERQEEENTVLMNDEPYVIQEYAPIIEGILVIAEGGDSAKIQKEINDALTALFDLAPHKIKVLKKVRKDVSQ